MNKAPIPISAAIVLFTRLLKIDLIRPSRYDLNLARKASLFQSLVSTQWREVRNELASSRMRLAQGESAMDVFCTA